MEAPAAQFKAIGQNKGMRRLLRFLRLFALVVIVGAVGLWVAVTFFDVTFELDGTGVTPIITAYDPEAHIDALERERQQEPQETERAVLAVSETGGGAYWTDYRGPRRDGRYDEQALRANWPEDGPPEVWRTKVGGGYASVVAANGRLFTIEQRRDQEVLAAYDLHSGRQLWEHSWPGLFQEAMGGDGPRSTPTWHDGVVYALGAEGELRALRAENGELIWKTNILDDAGAANVQWGMAGSPLVVDGKVIVQPGGRSGRSVAAYDAASGKVVWRALNDKAGYASPVLAEIAGQRQILFFTGERLLGVDPDDGRLLWDYAWKTSYDINSAQPLVVDESHVFISSGYGHGAALLKIVRAGDDFRVERVWENNTMKNKFNSSVLHEGHVYGLDEGILASIDVWTGERDWKGGRYGFGQLIGAGDRLIVLTEQGEVVLVEATPEEHRELARFQALEGKTWNNPAIADGLLIVRNQTEMAAYDLRL